MAKYKSKIYAQALADAVFDKKTEEKKIIANFLIILEKNRDLKKANEIISLTEELILKKTGNKKIALETARKIDIRNFINKFTNNGDIIEEKINPELIAGIKIIINNDKQLDFSLQKKLQGMFTRPNNF